MLRDYQVKLKDDVRGAWASGHRNVLAQLPCGGGKTRTMAYLAAELDEPGLVQAHRQELVGQISMAFAVVGVPHRIIAPDAVVREISNQHIDELGRNWVRPDARYAIAGVDTLIRRSDPFFDTVKHWQVDECFPAGTMVTTPHGHMSIEEIRVGMTVIGSDYCVRNVIEIHKNPMPESMVIIRWSHHEIKCTSGHPIWTKRGWVRASQLTKDDHVFMHGMSCRNNKNERTSTLPVQKDWEDFLYNQMRDDLEGEKSPSEENRTDQVLFKLSETDATEIQHRSLQHMRPGETAEDFIANHDNHKFAICICKDVEKQSDAFGNNKSQGIENSTENRSSTDDKGRQRETADTSGNFVRNTTTCDDAICGQDRMGDRQGILLQNRCGDRRQKNCNRGRRQKSFDNQAKDFRSTKGRLSNWIRLESVEVYQPSDIERNRDGFVYNLTVDGNNTYIAEGIVVHNCHHLLQANKWGRAVGMLGGARGIGWTATPCRGDRRSLRRGEGGCFDTLVQGPSMRWLINNGYLKEFRIYGLPERIDMSNVRTGSGGDFNQAELAEAAHKSSITGDIVKHAMALAPGKKGVTFAVDVQMAEEHAAAFRDAGVRAAVISDKTSQSKRLEIIRAYRGDGLDEVCNVDVLGEGFDLPGIVRASFARPTASYGLYVQQFGRALRPMEGEPTGIILDHVGNVLRHRGPPDKAREWSLDGLPPREAGEIPTRLCGNTDCMLMYEGFSATCPHCGWKPVKGSGEGRQRPEVLEGDLTLYDDGMLAALRAEVDRIAGEPDIPWNASQVVQRSVEKKHRLRAEAQSALAEQIDRWAGHWHGKGEPLDAVYRRFWATFGMDTLTALAMSGPKQREMLERVRASL